MAFIEGFRKLLSKLNIIDFLIILLMVVVIVAGEHYMNRAPILEWAKVKIIVKEQPDYIVNNIESGDILLEGEKIIGSIGEIEIKTKERQSNDMEIEINAFVVNSSNNLIFMGNDLKIGSDINIKTRKVSLKGTITDINYNETTKEEYVQKTIKMKITEVEPWASEVIQKGVKELNDKNKVIAEIVDKKESPQYFMFWTEDGEFVKKEHPYYKELILTVDILADKSEDGLFFHDERLKIGEGIKIKTDRMDISGRIISLD
ncbi:hypothetical protein COV19_05390 [Candidatus Woesearchaeota archaeon CG10_big_fil_rev_8_21_14_0_10_44_13]|nr:MAG: hypothetical protein COV19_05390 [Candidatus Woesearchaeota archaeon CG10_big_fil_rev_8_21_14_0_10_44_13]